MPQTEAGGMDRGSEACQSRCTCRVYLANRMTIRMICPEGHKLVVREEHAGRRVKCPQCRSIVDVPGERVEVAAPAVEPPEPTRVFACPTGHYFRARPEDSGKVVSCPTCRQSVRLPAPSPSRVAPARPGASTRAAATRGPVSSPAVDPEPERLWPLFLLVGGAAAVLLGIVLYLRFSGTS